MVANMAREQARLGRMNLASIEARFTQELEQCENASYVPLAHCCSSFSGVDNAR